MYHNMDPNRLEHELHEIDASIQIHRRKFDAGVREHTDKMCIMIDTLLTDAAFETTLHQTSTALHRLQTLSNSIIYGDTLATTTGNDRCLIAQQRIHSLITTLLHDQEHRARIVTTVQHVRELLSSAQTTATVTADSHNIPMTTDVTSALADVQFERDEHHFISTMRSDPIRTGPHQQTDILNMSARGADEMVRIAHEAARIAYELARVARDTEHRAKIIASNIRISTDVDTHIVGAHGASSLSTIN